MAGGEPDDGTGRQDHRFKWREIIVPKTVTGAVVALFAASIGAAFSGAILYAYYESKLQDTEDKVEQFTGAFDDTLGEAIDEIESSRDDARAQIRAELEPLEELQASEETLNRLIEDTSDSVWFLTTSDPDGQPSVGSAFVVSSDTEQSFLVTSLAVVRASTVDPGPEIRLRKGDQEIGATLWTWDENRDLALLVVDQPELPRLEWAPTDPPLGLGQRVFVTSGIGGSGASITQGYVADVSSAGIQHDASVSGAFEGGPLLNASGEVLGVATSSYMPLGFRSDDITYAPTIRATCERVLSCPDGEPADEPGTRR